MNRKIPTRKCIGCGELKEKNQLVRIVRSKEGEISLDMTGKKNGRGAYICPDPQCLKQAFKKKGLDRSFKIGVPESVYETLKKEMEELYQVPFYCWGLKEELGHAIGKEFRASIAVTDQGFAEALLKQLDK